jgi:hypothetical protein
MTSHPPSWAQLLLASIVPARHRDGVAGDLLEEYNEVQLPRRGQGAADAWYVGQVLLFLWRAARWWGLALGALIVLRDALDVYVPTDDYYVRSAWTTYSAVTIYTACGLRAGWRYGRVVSGTVIGIVAAVIASLIGLLSPLLFLNALSPRGGLWELLDVPVPILLVFGAVLGTVGAAIGRAGRRRPAATAA